MADVQILRAPSSAVPSDYTLPGAADLLLKAVYAEFDGSGAAADWLPCVTILSDSGDVIARAVDQAVKVTAGSNADVSWFRGVKHAAASSGVTGAPDYLILQGAGQTVIRPAIGDSDHAKFTLATRQTNADATFTYVLDAGGLVKEVDSSTAGRYLSICNFTWGTPAASSQLLVIANMFGGFGLSVSPDWSTTTTGQEDGFVQAFAFLTAGTGLMTVEPFISSGDVSIAFDAVYWTILRWNT